MELHVLDHGAAADAASPDVYLINSYKDGHYQAFSATDRKLLWGTGRGHMQQTPAWGEENRQGKLNYPILVDGKMMHREESA